ncbi:hypothetical protein ABMX48_09690 [Streptomyces cavourensis]
MASGAALLGDERMGEVMADAATGDRVLRTAVLRTHPNEVDPGHRPRYAKLVRSVCASDDDEVASLGHRALVRWLPWAPGAAMVLVDALTDMDRRGTWSSAAVALAEAAPAGEQAATALNRALTLLATGETADDAGAERDRPARQRLHALTDALTRRSGPPDRSRRAVLAEAGRTLAGHRDLVPQAVSLLVESLEPASMGADELHAALLELAALHADRPALAARTARTVGKGVQFARGAEAGDPETLLDVVARLAGTGDLAEGLFAAELTVACGRRTEWTGPWRTQLRMLRRHPCGDVRDVAYAQFTAAE